MRYETPKAEITRISTQDILMLSGNISIPGTDNEISYDDVMSAMYVGM